MRNIMTVIVRLFVDETSPGQLCGTVQPTPAYPVSQRTLEKISFQDGQRLVEILCSLTGAGDPGHLKPPDPEEKEC